VLFSLNPAWKTRLSFWKTLLLRRCTSEEVDSFPPQFRADSTVTVPISDGGAATRNGLRHNSWPLCRFRVDTTEWTVARSPYEAG